MQKIVFFNTAWMDFYDGIQGRDLEIHGGGAYVEEHGYGYEIYNFREINGKVYGYAQSGGNNHLERLGAKKDADSISNVLVVFTARHKEGGTYIVGWYKNATFYRQYQETRLKERRFKNEYLGYYVEADAKDACLLNKDERFIFETIPRGKGGMGRSNIWYADSENMKEFVWRVQKFINTYSKNKIAKHRVNRHSNLEKKKQVEKIAVKYVIEYYEQLGYRVESVETDNIGWDLVATSAKVDLKIEVKGLSGTEIMVELTPNEYKQMEREKDN